MARAKEVLRDLLELDPTEQDEIIEELWQSRTGGELSDEWEAEIARRVADLDAGRARTVDGEEVMARLRQRYRAP